MVTPVTNDRCYEYRGLSTDPKPVTGVGNGSVYFELDTSEVYMFNGTTQTWVLI